MNFVLANSDNRQKILASIKEDVTENAKNTPHKTKFNTTSLLQRISNLHIYQLKPLVQ